MPIYQLHETYLGFPDVEEAEDGLLAIGGDLTPERLIQAYYCGVFPWFSNDEPIMWWAPDPRFILLPENLKVSKSMRNILNREKFKVTFDTAFKEVINNCQKSPRKGQDGTWITEDMKKAYTVLHEKGIAHSVEVWEEDVLVGGLYGISLGTAFFGESMFSKASNASKTALISIINNDLNLNFTFIDCQIHTDHLATMGANEIPRKSFMGILASALQEESFIGSWNNK